MTIAELAIGLELLLVEELVGGRLIGKGGVGAAIAEQRQRQTLDQGGLQVDQGGRAVVGVADPADDVAAFRELEVALRKAVVGLARDQALERLGR